MKMLRAVFVSVAAPVAVEFLLGSNREFVLLFLLAIPGIVVLPVLSAYCFTRFARPPAGAGWWIFVLNFFAVLAAFFYATRGIRVDL